MREISEDDVDFNDFIYEVDNDGTMCARWMDNGLVYIVSTCHKPGKTVKRQRRRPRLTKKNKNHPISIYKMRGTIIHYSKST